MNRSLKAALACFVSAVWVSGVALANDTSVELGVVPEVSPSAAPASSPVPSPPPSGKQFPELKIGGIAYEMKPAGSLRPHQIPAWYGDPKKLQPNAPVLVPAGFLMPSGPDEKAIFECEKRFSMIWAALIRYYGVGKVGDLPKGVYDYLINNLEEFNEEMQLVCGNAVRSPEDQAKAPSKVPGKPSSPCRSKEYQTLLNKILDRNPVEVTGAEMKKLRQCGAWGILLPPLR